MKKILIAFFTFCLLFSVSLAKEGTSKTIKVNKLIEDEISEKGEVDYFNFSLSDPGSLQIKFEFDVEGSYNVKLVNTKTEKTLQTTTFKSSVNTSTGRYEQTGNKIRIAKGNYQIQVTCDGYSSFCDEEYELEVIYDEESGDRYEKEPNNDAKTAMLIDYNRNIIGNLESTSDVDYYMVEIPSNGELYTTLEFDNEAVYNIETYSENNGSLKSLKSTKYEAKLNQNSDTYFATSGRMRIPEGNYYFKISRNGSKFSNEDYTFCVKFLGNTYGYYEKEYNDEPRNANEITTNIEYIGNLNSSSDVDYYRTDIWNSNKFTIKMNVPEGAKYTVVTYKNENGTLKQLKSETFSSGTLTNFVSGSTQEVSTGEYYFKVSSRNYSNEDYSFLVETGNTYSKTNIVLEINNPYMLVNGQKVSIDGDRATAPVILNNRTMLPIRAVIESLGGSVIWNEAARGVNITLDNNNIYLTLDSALAYVNGEQKWLDVAPTSINGRTMLPIKFVMDNLGGSVIWNATTGTVTITY